jgi:hypothetical protein
MNMNATAGDLTSRVTSDTTLLRDVTTDSLVGLITGSLTLVATLVLMSGPARRPRGERCVRSAWADYMAPELIAGNRGNARADL